MCQAITEGRALDFIEIDAASNRGIDEIRDLREKVNYAPNQARYKVYIIDEVHMLTKEASNALLKTLEEPPPHIIFVLATTEAHKVLPTLMSRCQRFDFRRISQADIVSKLTAICQAQDIHINPEGLQLTARSATGSLRDAENLLEQLATYYGSEIELHQIQAILGITGDYRAREIVKHIVDNDVSTGMTTINSVNSDGLDLKQFNREVLEYLRKLLLIKTGSAEAVDLTTEDMTELKELASRASLSQILKAVKLFGQLELGFDSYSTLPLELALVECALASEEKEEIEPELRQPTKAATPPAKPRPAKVPAPEEAVPTPPPAKPEPVSAPAAETTAPTSPPAKSKPVSAPAAETTAPASPPEPGTEIEQLASRWKQIIEEAPAEVRRTNAAAILRSAGVKPVAFKDDTVVLAFKYNIHRENMEKLENKKVAEKIVSSFIGRSCQVRCIHEPEDNHLLQAALRMGAKIIDTEEK